MKNTIIRIFADDYWSALRQKEQTETIKWVGIGIVAALVVLIFLVIAYKSPRYNKNRNGEDLRMKLEELSDKNKKLEEEIEKLKNK